MAVNLTLYAQQNQLWSSKTLGHGPTTIGKDGAVVCSLAAILHVPPDVVNDTLLAADAFLPNQALLPIDKLPYDKVFDGRLQLVKQSMTYITDEMPDQEVDVLRAHVRAGKPAIIRVNVRPGRDNYLAASDVAEDSNILVWDPWYGDTKPVTERYSKPPGSAPSTTPGKAIVRFDLFELRSVVTIPDHIVVPEATLRPAATGKAVQDLQNCLSWLGYHIPANEQTAQLYGVGTESAVKRFQALHGLSRTGIFDDATRGALARAISVAGWSQNRIEGRILLERGRPAQNLTLRVYHEGAGGKQTPLGEVRTDDQGFYALSYDPPAGKATNLKVSAEWKKADGTLEEKPLSTTKYGVEKYQTLNLVAPSVAQPLTPEHERLTADLEQQLGAVDNLDKIKENDDCRDLTLLHQSTGWDARLIALAATAAKLAKEPGVPEDQAALYGLLRAGLPSDKRLLAQVDADVVEQALQRVSEAGIVHLDKTQIGTFKRHFEKFSVDVQMDMPAPGSSSSYSDLLAASGLDEDAQEKFKPIYVKHGGDAVKMWDEAREAGLDDAQIGKLQLQGKLSFLTTNSVKLTAQLQESLTATDALSSGHFIVAAEAPSPLPSSMIADIPARLVEQGFYKAEIWQDAINRLVQSDNPSGVLSDEAKNALDKEIPTVFAGETVEARRNLWAENMARKLRMSYPTQVIAHRIAENEIKLPQVGVSTRKSTAQLLRDAAGQGYRLGQTPVEYFFQTHAGVAAGMSVEELEAAKEQIKTVHRVFQITPTDEAMPVLLDLNLTSAHAVTSMPEEVFVTAFSDKASNYGAFSHKDKLVSVELATKIYRKSQQVSSISYNLFAIAAQIMKESGFSVTSASNEARQDAQDELIKRFPTMESLFGSMDFCECEHCRSVLSPAAYLVDLLQFVEVDDMAWSAFAARWKEDHGHEYTDTYVDKSEKIKYRKPYDALTERRPDLPHIPLTCENTNTALPYIDIVNEILEYYVANKGLTAEAAYDTGEAVTAELLAEPQNVIAKAYEVLQEACYPLTLPFDLWLETVRQFCDYFETPLARVLEVFRTSDKSLASQQAFDRSNIFIESLGISPSELRVFTDPLASWHKLYGFESADEATTNTTDPETKQRIDLNSAKALSRRLGVTYKELVDIVQTGFVNPMLENLAILYKLGVNIRDVHFYLEHKSLLAQDLAQLSADKQKQCREVEAFREKLKDLGIKFKIPWEQFEQEVQAIPLNQILVLSGSASGCDFDETTLQYADDKPAKDIDFLRINLFVRLWRKLGWSIEETDRALQAFVPKNAPFDAAHLDKQPLKTALIYLAHLKALDEKLALGKQSRLKLLTLWSDIATTGKKPLYAQLFLTRSMLKSDDVFDHPSGDYLSPTWITQQAAQRWHRVQLASTTPIDPVPFAAEKRIELSYDELQEVQHLAYEGVLSDADKAALVALPLPPTQSELLAKLLDDVQVKAQEFSLVKGHMLALQGALGVTADDIGRILNDAGKSLETAELSLPNVSLLYRYGLLAKGLKAPVRDLIALKQLSGLDPCTLLHPEPLASIEENYPFSQTLRFVEVVQQVKESGFAVEDLEYLLRHRFDETAKYRLNHEATLVLLKTLADGIRAIRIEHAVPEDPATMTEQVLRQKLGLALSPDVVERFLAMIKGTAEFTATKANVELNAALKPETYADEPAIREVPFYEIRHEQKLTYCGVLFDAERQRLKDKFPQSSDFAALLDDVALQACSFFDNHLSRQSLNPELSPHGEAGFLQKPDDFDGLFKPLKPFEKINPADNPDEKERKLNANEQIAQDNAREIQRRHHRTAQAFLPFLQQRLIKQFIVQTMTAHTGADPVLVESFLTDTRLLGLEQAGASTRSLLDVFSSIAERVLTATFYASSDCTGAALQTSLLADANTGLKDKDGKPKPDGTESARIEGYLEAPAPGAYRFYAVLPANATVELVFEHLSKPTLDGQTTDNYVELKPGIPFHFTLQFRNLNGGDAQLLVQGETLPKGGLAQLVLYPLVEMEGAERALLLLSKSLRLLQGLGLGEREARYLLTHSNDFGDVKLSELPTAPTGDTAVENEATVARFDTFLRLVAYTRLKRDLAGDTADLIGIFEANGTGGLDKVYPLIAKLTRRDEITVKATANALFTEPAFASEQPLLRLWDALQIVERFGAPVASLIWWTHIVSDNLAAEERSRIARDLKEAVKARFEPEAWQRVAQPIFDKLRQRQRDALAAHVMHILKYARMEQLYEHFLIDPGMEPVVQTSRIRLAIASVQLFIQRCLLNLELKVHPSAIVNAEQWEWMKRYRVWEANRKIFLFPENWLEPEFRDDKTYLFRELEGALLQDDVSNDLVEDAFLNYLKKLDELARLDIVAMHLENKGDWAQNTLHVFGRTFSQPHKYFYRRCAHGMWTPWEPVTCEVEGDHLAPVVWRDRLYLFWLTFREKIDQSAQMGSRTANATLAEAKLSDLVQDLKSATTTKFVEVQLHWSEYLRGEWSTRVSGEYALFGGHCKVINCTKYFQGAPVPFNIFDPRSIFVCVSEANISNSTEKRISERGLFVNMSGYGTQQAFYRANGNSALSGDYCGDEAPASAYNKIGERVTSYLGSGPLAVRFKQRIGGMPQEESVTILELQEEKSFTLLPCNNDIPTPQAIEDAYKTADETAEVKKAIESGLKEIMSLMKPVFYQDDEHTLFMEPTVVERTIEEWKEYGAPVESVVASTETAIIVEVEPQDAEPPLGLIEVPEDGFPFLDPVSKYNVRSPKDWMINRRTVVVFDGEATGPKGGYGIKMLDANKVTGAIVAGGSVVTAHAMGALAADAAVVFTGAATPEAHGLSSPAEGLMVVGAGGFNPALAHSLAVIPNPTLGAGDFGAAAIRS